MTFEVLSGGFTLTFSGSVVLSVRAEMENNFINLIVSDAFKMKRKRNILH